MLPLYDENPTRRTPVVTIALLVLMGAIWILVQGAGLDDALLSASMCKFGLVAGALTHRLPAGTAISLGEGARCLVDPRPLVYLTPLTSMFLHGSWTHILGNGWFLWIFGNNVEDSMGRLRFLAFYILCGLAAAAAQVAIDPSASAPMIGASGAISGVMGAYVLLFPRVRVNTLVVLIITIRVIQLPAWVMLLYWFGIQVVEALAQLGGLASSSGVAVMAHVGGFVAGVLLVKLFVNQDLLEGHQPAGRRQWS